MKNNNEMKHTLAYVGKRISDRRNAMGMTQEALAEKAGLGQKYITVIENGTKCMQLDTFIKICDALNLDYSYVIEGEFKKPRGKQMTIDFSYLKGEEVELFKKFFDTFFRK